MKHLLSLILIALFVFAACKKKTSDPEPAPAPTTTTTTTTGGTTTTAPSVSIGSTPQVQFSIDGVAASYVESVTGTFVGNGQSNIGTINSAAGTMTVGTSFFNSAGDIITVYKRTFHYTPGAGLDPDTEFSNFFQKRTHPYTMGVANGIAIEWHDAAGNIWSTENGTADQTGSVFTIVDNLQDYERDGGDLSMKMHATFNCKLYNASGAVKTLTNGKIVGYYSYH